MPIKFHCVHCGMYLGISRSKIGTVVDCPACGRSVRVPEKDGDAERVGRPSLNHEDSQLADALREVAAIAQSSSMAMPQLPFQQNPSDARETREVHAPPPRVIPAEPQPPAQPIEPKPRPQHQAVSETEETYYSDGPLSELAGWADEGDAEDESTNRSKASGTGTSHWANDIPWKMWLAFVSVGFVSIIAGFALGRWDGLRHSSPGGNAGQTTSPENEHPELLAPLGEVALTGTVETSEGEPIENAWIYAFPKQRIGEEKIPADWLSEKTPDEYATGHQLAIASLRAMGGNATQTGTGGRFQLRLAEKGVYELLVCSPKNIDKTSNQKVNDLLDQFIHDSEAFLDFRDRALLEHVEYEGETKVIIIDTLKP